MSGAFLYVGIVAIWAFVLVPRWLRRSNSQPQASPEYAVDDQAVPQDYHGLADEEPDEFQASEYEYEQDEYASDGSGDYAGTEPEHGYLAAPPASQARPPHRRSKVLQARRRLLTLLVLLAAVAGTCTGLRLTSWWVCLPPAGMLGIYLLLLREAAVADAEHVRLRAAQARTDAARERARISAAAPAAAQHSADIIDISARVGDQLYDQYADATIRAVGD